MTLSTTVNTKTYTGDNATVAFSFPYLFYANGDLQVTVAGTVRTLNGGGTYDYTLTGAGNPAGGTVTFNNAPAIAASVIIQRIVSYTQQTDFEDFDGNPADVTEKQFDLVAMMAQQLDERVARALLAPIGTALTSNNISGTITATNKAIVISTAGPSVAELSSFGADIDVVLTGVASNDMLKWNGTNWVNFTQVDTAQIADNAVTAAKIAAGAVGISELDSTAAVDFISGVIESPIDQDYRLIVKSPYAGTITETTTISASGTCTATFKINTTALGGTANSVSNSEQSQAHASANTFAAGDDIVLTVSANSSCNRLSFTIEFTRTG